MTKKTKKLIRNPENNIPNRIIHPVLAIRLLFYKNITPFGYLQPITRVFNALLNQPDEYRKESDLAIKNNDRIAVALDDIWGTYLNIPENRRRYINHQLGISKQPEGYYSFNSPNITLGQEIDEVLGRYPETMGLGLYEGLRTSYMNGILGNYIMGRDYDKKGSYLYYSDSLLNQDGTPDIKTGWDINPYSNTVENSEDETTESTGQYGQDLKDKSYQLGKKLLGNQEDISMGIGTPVPIYGKIYLDDIYGIKTNGAHWLPEVIVKKAEH